LKVPFFDLGSFIQDRKTDVLEVIERVLDGGIYVGGEEVLSFEKAFASSVESKHCVSVGNGLDALRLILESHNIGPGDEVIVPGFTFYATWLAVMQTGASPVAVDVNLEDASINPALLKNAITSKTRAIIVVHLFGISADMLAVGKVAKDYGLLVFEDAAQAHSGKTNAGPVGSSGDAAAFSFYPTKNLGALGDGGAITTNNAEVAARMMSLRSYGVGKTKYEHVEAGWNSRLDTIQAAVLSLFLRDLSEVTDFRRSIATRYEEALSSTDLEIVGSNGRETNVFHHFVVRTANREELRQDLLTSGVGTDLHYPYYFNSISPVRQFLHERGLPSPPLPNAEKLASSVVSLPIGPWMSGEQVTQVAGVLSGLGLGGNRFLDSSSS
jgi:dTDP-4-amino-4,6-dideoxygalactose transaminase